MKKRFLSKSFILLKKIFLYPKQILRNLIFGKKKLIIEFSQKNILKQKFFLINLIDIKNFNLIEDYIKNKKNIFIIKLFKKLKEGKFEKIVYIYIYSYLINLNKYVLANNYHNILCKIIKKNTFFYFQISTLNHKNILYFKRYSKTFNFFLIKNFLLNIEEKKFIETILKLHNNFNSLNNKFTDLDFKFKKYIENKKINIIGPLKNKIIINKNNLKNFIIIRFKNNNYLKKDDIHPNIIYLNGTATRQLSEKKNYLKKDNNLIWIVFIQKNFYKNSEKKSFFNYRFANNGSAFLFNCFTELNLLQKVLLDLFLFTPHKITLYNFDIKLSKYYSIGYGIYNTKKKQEKIKLSFLHNQIVMFDFINYFYKREKIKLDKRLNAIINMGKDKYLLQLEKNWKN